MLSEKQMVSLADLDRQKDARIAELEARITGLIAGSILPADGADEITVDGVRWVRVPAESTVTFHRTYHQD